MIDLVQAQEDLTQALLSSPQLVSVNVKSYRRMRLQSELDFRTVMTASRNGRTGAGVLVMMPTADSKRPNVTGPMLDWSFPVIALEQPTLNMSPPDGTLLSAEEIGQIVMDVLHLYGDESLAVTYAVDGRAMEPEKELTFPGCLGYRTNFKIIGKSIQTPRAAPVQVDVAGGLATLSCATPGTAIKYTLDGTFPASDIGGNPGSALYTAPFQVSAGQVIRATAYTDGMNNGIVRFKEVV